MSQNTGAALPITQVTNVTIPANDVVANIGGSLTGASISTVLDNGIGSIHGELLYRSPSGWAELAISNNLTIASGTLDTTAVAITPGSNQYVFSNGTGSIVGVPACGGIDLILNPGATVTVGTYVIATALPYSVAWTDAKTWISGSSPSAALDVQAIHNGTTSSIGGLGALTVNAGTPNSPVKHAASAPNTNIAGDTIQVTIGNLSGAITALGLHLDFIRTG